MEPGYDPQVCPLLAADIESIVELSTSAGWNQTTSDWLRMIELERQGCFAIKDGDRVVATTTLLCYGLDLGWVGMVLTHRDYQRRGLARKLVEASLCLADHRRVRCLKLDATDMGRPLYLALGFIDEQPIERWRREPQPAVSTAPRVQVDRGLDRRAFGCDRSCFLNALPPEPWRPGIRARYFGPYVSGNPAQAENEIRRIIQSYSGAWFWDLLPAHPHAARIAASLGFQPVRKLVRMRRGPEFTSDDSLVYAIGGFEAG